MGLRYTDRWQTSLRQLFGANRDDEVARLELRDRQLEEYLELRLGAWVTPPTTPAATNVTGATTSGSFKRSGDSTLDFRCAVLAGTATAAAPITIAIPGGFVSVAEIQPVTCLLSVGGVVSTLVSARVSASSNTVQVWASAAGANFGVGQSAVCRVNGTIEIVS